MERNKELYDQYFDSSFKQVNILSTEQYEKACESFESIYGRLLPENRDAPILDVGCGTGHFLYYIHKKGYTNYLGIDVSSQQIEICRRNGLQNVQLADAMNFLKGKKETFDLVSAHDFLEHIAKDKTLRLLDLIYTSLKDGGKFVVRVPNMSNPFSIDSRYSDVTHETGFTAKSLYQILWVGGFREIKILPPRKIAVHSVRNFVRKFMVDLLHRIIQFSFYIQDFTVPMNLDKILVAVSTKK